MMNGKLNIKRVIYSNPWTHIIWEDGTKTSAKCDKEDTYDELTGFLMCVFKKKTPPKEMRKMFDNYVYGNNKKYIKRDEKIVKEAKHRNNKCCCTKESRQRLFELLNTSPIVSGYKIIYI